MIMTFKSQQMWFSVVPFVLCPGVVPESESQVETSRKDGHQHHEAPRLPHAVIQSPPNAS